MAATLNKEVGKYPVKVVRADVSEEDGVIQVAVRVEFQDGEQWTKYLSNKNEKQLEFMRKGLKVIGFDIDRYDIAELASAPTSLEGSECEAVVGEWEGKRRIDWLNRLRKVPDASSMSDLTAKLRSVKKTEGGEEGGGL